MATRTSPWATSEAPAHPGDQSERARPRSSTDINAAAASFEVFADDVIALADHLGLVRFIIGGISLGAGTALNLAVRYPDRVAALVLCRPAWLDRPQAEFNRNAYTEIADLLDRYPPRTPQSAPANPHISDRSQQFARGRGIPPRPAHPPTCSPEFGHPAHLPRF